MEKTNEIRYYINLMESVNKKVEENQSINEANPFGAYAREGKIIAKELESVFNVLKVDAKIKPILAKAGVSTTDDMLKLIKNDFKSIDNLSNKVGKLAASEAGMVRGSFELGILKSSTTNKKLLDIAAENLVKDTRFIEKYKAYGNETDFINQLKKNGYSDQAAKSIAKKRVDLKAGKLTTTSEKFPKNKNKNTPPPGPKTKWWDDFITQVRQKKSWKELLLWAGTVGIGGALLWNWLSSSGEEKPKDTPEWLPCVQDLIDSGKGRVGSSATNQISAVVVTDEYPKGLQFYSNGRVMDVENKKMGSYKCKDGKIVPTPINEEEPTATGNGSLENIEITWDGETKPIKTDDTDPKPKPKKSIYHDCESKDFPLEFGCKSTKIKEMQKCLGMETRYHTGNFGPLTKAKLGVDSITKELYDTTIANCSGDEPLRKMDFKPAEKIPSKTITPANPKIDDSKLKMMPKVDMSKTPAGTFEDIKKRTDENGDLLLKGNVGKNQRIKYKGPDLDPEELSRLDKYYEINGYKQIKDKDKSYGEKYVWAKQ